MKKKLQIELKELALELQAEIGSGDVRVLKQKVLHLLEKLTVLEYLEGQIEREDSISGHSYDSKSFREQNWFVEPEPVPQPEHKEDLVEPLMEKIKDIVAQMPQESQQVDELLEKVLPKKRYVKNDLEEFASDFQEMPVFERKETDTSSQADSAAEAIALEKSVNQKLDNDRPKSINETVNTGLQIGLNDRIAFIKHLFEGRTEDFMRVLSQINSMSSFTDAEQFISGQVKPEYNQWLDKEDYADRFMNIVEKSFN